MRAPAARSPSPRRRSAARATGRAGRSARPWRTPRADAAPRPPAARGAGRGRAPASAPQDRRREVGDHHAGARAARRLRSCGGRPAGPRRLRRSLARVASTASGSLSTAHTGSNPSRRAAIASTPDPQPASSRDACGGELGQQLQAGAGGGVLGGAEGHSGVDHDVGERRPGGVPRGPHAQPAGDLHRAVEGAHGVTPGGVLGLGAYAAAHRPGEAPRGHVGRRRHPEVERHPPAGQGPLAAPRAERRAAVRHGALGVGAGDLDGQPHQRRHGAGVSGRRA